MKPHPLVVSALVKLSRVIPTWKIIPSNDVIDSAFKVPEVRKEVHFHFKETNIIIIIFKKFIFFAFRNLKLITINKKKMQTYC